MQKTGKMTAKNTATLLLALAGASSPASAQYYGGGYYNQNPLTNPYSGGNAAISRQLSAIGKAARSNAGTRESRKTAPKPAPKSATTTFKSVAPSLAPQAMAANADTPEARKKMKEAFADGLSYYEKEIAKAGVPANDVARATSFFIIAAYNVATGGKLSKVQMQAVRDDVRQALLHDAKFQASSNRSKQETYETMAILGEFITTGYTVGLNKKDEKIQEAFRAVAKDQLERFLGTPIKKMRVTDAGLQFK